MTKFTNFIEIEKGGIDPKNRSPFEIAMGRFNCAQGRIAQLEEAPDRANYETLWNEFALELEASWKAFIYEGNKLSTEFQSWAGKFVGQRRSDKLLIYLTQSRHIAMHKLISLDWETPKIEVKAKLDRPFSIREFKIFADGTQEIEFKDEVPGNEPKFVTKHGKALLPQIHNGQNDKTFDPPTSHLGNAIGSRDPVHAAKLGVEFYSQIYNAALEKFL